MRRAVLGLLLLLPLLASAAKRDRDRDGIPDVDDACPDDPGGEGGDRGCPPPPPPPGPDGDGDGVADAVDACPATVGLPGRQGCPNYPHPPASAGFCHGALSSAPLRVGLALPVTIDCSDGRIVQVATPTGQGVPPGLTASSRGRLYWNQAARWERWEADDGSVVTPLPQGGFLPPAPGHAGDCEGSGGVHLQRGLSVAVQCVDGRNLSLTMPTGTWLVGDDPVRHQGDAQGRFSWDAQGVFSRFEQRDASGAVRVVRTAPIGTTEVPAPAPASVPSPPVAAARGACSFPRSGGEVEVTLMNTQSDGAVTLFLVDGACAETPLRALQPRETLVQQVPVGQLLVARRGAMDPAGAATHWFWPLASDAPAVRVPSRPFASSESSCHGTVLGVRRAPFVPADAEDAILFRCDRRAEVRVVSANGMAMKMNPARMPAEGSSGTLWFTDGSWERFVADGGEVFQTVSTLDGMDDP